MLTYTTVVLKLQFMILFMMLVDVLSFLYMHFLQLLLKSTRCLKYLFYNYVFIPRLIVKAV